MGKASKSKREEKAVEAKSATEGDYEFKLPAFDEQAFIRRELQSSKASFYVLAFGLLAGLLAIALYASPLPWYWGWLPILGSLALVRPLLQRMKFSEEITSWKAMFGNMFMLFFTALSVWILGVNVV